MPRGIGRPRPRPAGPAPEEMNNGEVWIYQKNSKTKPKHVYIENYDNLIDGRVSNWVDFRYIKKDGTLGKKGCDYYREEFIKKVKNAKVKITVAY